ncbi:uncharacterized protein C15orf39 homolog [Clupea harengus]|uniref:Uncharacterized protein C15orf39 homolog n=1 Tax=Clupea harengus TaxID=7950 RepID=A0A6P8EWN5_CLUHA|nr:uncharacterized protein C15orf39 homolog [Clupea harengus]
MIRPSQLPVTMTSKPAQGFMDSASPSQMLGVEGALGPAAPLGRHMPGALPRYPHSEALQYAGPYYSYRLCGQEGGGGDPPPAWSPSLAYLGSNSGSPVMPPAIAEGSIKSPIVYRQEKVLPPASSGGSPLPVAQELGAKRRYAGYYPDRDQGKCRSPSVVTPVVVRRQSLTGANLCSQADSPVGLAIPKPLYGHNSCCSDSRCTAGHSYSVEQGLHRMPPNVYEDEWLIGYAPSRKDLEMLLDQRGLHAEPSAEVSPGKEVAAEEYCGMDMHLNRRVPTYGEAGHSGYACSPTNGTTFIGIPPEPCQRLQFSSREYPGLPPSHSHMYDPAALARYRIPPKEYPHAPRYVQVPQRSRVYYTQEHMEAEKASVRADVREKYSDRTPSLSPGRRDACPSSPAHCSLQQHIPPVFANPPMHCHMHLPRHHFPPRNFDHPAYHPYQLHLNGGHPKAAPMRPPSHPLPSNLDNPLDYSLHRGQPGSSPRQPGSSPRQPGSSPRQPGSSPRQFPVSHSLYSIVPHTPLRPEHRSPNHVASVKTPLGHYMEGSHFSSDVNEKYGASDKHPSDFSGQKVHYRDLLAQPDIRRLLSTRDKISSDDEDVYEVEVTTKKRKVEMDHEAAAFPQVPASPPMPVINQVFSLAPYKLYLEAAGVLPPVKRQPPGKLKQDPEISEGSDLHDSVRGTKEITETMTIKNENKKMDLPNKEETEENHFCDRTFVKNKASNVASCTTAVKFPLKTDLEADNPSLEVTVPKYKVEVTSEHGAETTPSSHKSTKDATLEAKPAVKPSPPLVTLTPKLLPLPPKNPVRGNLQNIPPQCLKLTSFNIILPEALRTNVRLAPHAPNPLPAAPHSPALRTSVRPAPHAPNPLPAAPHSPALRTSVRPAPHAPNPLPAAPHSPALRTSVRPAPHPPNPLPAAPHSPAEPTPDGSIARQARHQFMEMHQSLCKLIYTFTTQTPPQELQGWLSKMELVKTLYPPDKHQKVSCLVGVKAREVWERAGERSLALQKVLSKLKGYHASGGCPFPHVMRAGGVFIPMLVVREGLFPQVQGTFIDQVLQEHRVELRPTTLSEEKYLTQLQKRACSSKLRRLLSFRHLPDIYADVLNLFYYTCVCKVLDSTSQGAAKKTPQM